MPTSRPKKPTDHLPLKAVDFHILLVLTDQALHGYGIVKAIETRTEGSIRLEPGNLYRYVRRLEEVALVEPAGHRESDGPAGGRRRYFRVTDLGRQVLAAEASRMRRLAAAVEATLPLGDIAS